MSYYIGSGDTIQPEGISSDVASDEVVEGGRSDPQGHPLDMMTPAQAYAYAVKTGQDVNRTLHFTIERKQPLRKAHWQQQPAPPQPSNAGIEHGATYARRLYASAIGARSLTNLGSSTALSTQLPETPAGGSMIPTIPPSEGRKTSRVQPYRNTSRSPFDADPPPVQSFNAADLYHSGLPRYAFGSGVVHSGVLTSVAKKNEPMPLSAPPVSGPSPLPKYSPFHASHSLTELSQPQRGVELLPMPCLLGAPPPGHPGPRLSSKDFQIHDSSSSHQMTAQQESE
ncbi:hypothetical protein V8B97DRAFT_174256 [Scleroderma yunnanense]